MYDFPNRLRHLREINGMDRKEFAAKINASVSTISRYENNKMVPTLETARLIAEIFGTTLDWLAGDGNLEDYKGEM